MYAFQKKLKTISQRTNTAQQKHR